MVKRNVPQVAPLNSSLRQHFVQLIADQTGLKIRGHDQAVFEQAIAKRLYALGLSFPENYYQLLEAQTSESSDEWKRFIAGITNSESFFFRDKGQFALLKTHLFPDLIQAHQLDKTLRICSAGCSTGEEPYSIAMLLHTLIPDLENWDITLLGIDINSTALDKARAAEYRPWSFRGVDTQMIQRFFHKDGSLYQLTQAVKDMVKFQTVNLFADSFEALDTPVENMDLILCRNVFIYFNDAAIKEVLIKFYEALNPSGYLVVGHAELHSQNLNQFQVKVFEDAIAYQRVTGASNQKPSRTVLRTRKPRLGSVNNGQNLDQQLEGSTTKLQKTSLELLRQLPGDTKIPRLGNLTAAELISQIEHDLDAIG